MVGSALASHSDQLSPHAGQNGHCKLPVYKALELAILKEKGANVSRAKKVLLRILIFPDWVTYSYHEPIIQTNTSLDIFSLGPHQSPWSSFLIGKGVSVSGKKGCNGLPQSSTKEDQVALHFVSEVFFGTLQVLFLQAYFLKTNLN